jgi:hypothetical protein
MKAFCPDIQDKKPSWPFFLEKSYQSLKGEKDETEEERCI